MSKNIKNLEGYVMNTNSGILHTKECADGKTGVAPVDAGRRKHYAGYKSAIRDKSYTKDHQVDACIG